jgi:hypothetical protein
MAEVKIFFFSHSQLIDKKSKRRGKTFFPFNQGDQMSMCKNGPKCSLTHFCQNLFITLVVEKKEPKNSGYFCNLHLPIVTDHPTGNLPIWSPCLQFTANSFFSLSLLFVGMVQNNNQQKKIVLWQLKLLLRSIAFKISEEVYF